MPVTVIVPPAELPISLDILKSQIRIDGTDEDALLMGYLAAAVGYAERTYDLALVTQTLDVDVVAFPIAGRALNVRVTPLQSVTSVTYADGAGGAETWDGGSYRTIPAQGVIWPLSGGSYPTAYDSVVVRGVFGFGGAADVPEPIRQALMLMVADWHRDRESTVPGLDLRPVPLAAKVLLDIYRRNWL